MKSLRQKVLHGIGWRALADILKTVLEIAFTALLARLLGLADFGLAAMCLIFIRFIRAFTDVGFGTAVIQSAEITPRQISAIFCLHLLFKILVGAVAILAAPLASAFFEEPQLVDLIRVLAVVLMADGLAFPHIIARKRMEFRGYTLLDLAAMIAGNVAGVILAFAGFGVWSLIFRHIVLRLTFEIGIWPIVRWYPTRPDFRGIGRYVRFGFTMFGSTATRFLSQHMAAIIIGKFIGVEVLGLYNIAYNLGIAPAQKIHSVLSIVLTPAFATLQTSISRLRHNLYVSLVSVSTLFVPMMLGLAAVAPQFVVVGFGEKWAASGNYLILLSFIGLLHGIQHLLRTVLIAAGKPSKVLAIDCIEAAIGVPFLWLASAQFGIWGVIGVYLILSVLAFQLSTLFVQRFLGDGTLVARATWRSLAAGAGMFLIVMSLPEIVDLSVAMLLVAQIATGMIAYTVIRLLTMSASDWQLIGSWPILRRLVR